METISENKSFGGRMKRIRHSSSTLNCDMVFAIYLPPQAQTQAVPVLYWLSGLTCTDENFTQKAGAQRVASELGIAIVCPDTSPRGTDLPGEHDNYYFGSGAGFYLNATQSPWDQHYRMYDYIVDELPALITKAFPVNDLASLSGHSMGGHGALTIALKNPDKYQSVSAFSPICNPTQSEWGQYVFQQYLGEDQSTWADYDTCQLIAKAETKLPLLVDQGDADEFMEQQLMPQALKSACEATNYPLTFRLQPDYDHSYFFVASFIEHHLHYHAEKLGAKPKGDKAFY